MDFFAAPLLWGLFAAGIPVAIHLIGRTKPIPHRFPAMRFIIKSQKSSSRALKLKHLIVLLLRMLALAAFAMALARPFWGDAKAEAAWIGAGIAIGIVSLLTIYLREYATGLLGLLIVSALYLTYPRDLNGSRQTLYGDFVLVVDQSMSMGYLETDGTRFDRARRQVSQFLDRLKPDSRVALILATETPERALGRLSFRHESIREKMQNAAATGRGLDLERALLAAQTILEHGRNPSFNKEAVTGSARPSAIVLFSDLQAGSINVIASRSVAGKASGVARNPFELIVVDVGSEQAANGAVLSAVLPGTVLPAEAPASISAKVRPADTERPVLVELYIDEKRIDQKRLEPKGQQVLDVDFHFQTGAAGSHSGRIHLPDSDRLPTDQAFLFAYTAGRPASALIIESPAQGQEKGSAFFVRAALQPSSNDLQLGISGLTFTVEAPMELTLAKLSKFRVVLLADCGPLSPGSWSALQQWVNDGGGLFVWLGSRSATDDARRMDYQELANHRGLLPGKIGNVTLLEKPLQISVAQPDHPLVAHFTPGVASILRETQVRKLVKITAEPRDPNASVVLALTDGTPLMLEKIYGRGRVISVAIDPARECSDLPSRGEAYVTLLLDAIRLLTGDESESSARLGMPLMLTLPSPPEDNQVIWKRPGAPTTMLRVDLSSTEVRGAPVSSGPVTVIVPPIESPGVQNFSWTPAGSTTPQVKMIAVNADPAESDLEKAKPEIVRRALARYQPELVRHFAEARILGGETTDGSHGSRELSAGVLLALIAFLLGESFLSNRLYRNEIEPVPELNGAAPSDTDRNADHIEAGSGTA